MANDDERIALFPDYENLATGARDGLGVLPFDFGAGGRRASRAGTGGGCAPGLRRLVVLDTDRRRRSCGSGEL